MENLRRPDVLWQTDNGERVALEARFSTAKDEAYIADMELIGAPSIEIDVTDADADVAIENLLGRFLTEQARWIVPPYSPFKNTGVHRLEDRRGALRPMGLSAVVEQEQSRMKDLGYELVAGYWHGGGGSRD